MRLSLAARAGAFGALLGRLAGNGNVSDTGTAAVNAVLNFLRIRINMLLDRAAMNFVHHFNRMDDRDNLRNIMISYDDDRVAYDWRNFRTWSMVMT